ncbi:ATP-dependent helicase [Futiania mangrovi]|uniref:DNA 3'-5' helicase n=1 Tax=Futiania mangrovi TaxID=2959716 RepID=A0A9J6PB96_9PROT|nr:UvrD-helicase domain-containing protein [Futiania mangrovii]MCP1334968.1 UvrD-helicase domain-containing protein [Futiania mangrovii]
MTHTPDTAAPYLAGLNEAQREAVLMTDGAVLVLAGAGTGKTRVLTTRLAHILATGLAWPSQILAVTFTNKAAREMQERIGALVGGVVEGMPWLGTFHAIAAKILRRHAELAGLKSNFTILDADDQIRLIKQLLQAEGVDEKRWPARMIHAQIDRWKNKGLGPDQVPGGEAHDLAGGKGLDIYRQYQERLRVLNAVDFGDLLLLTTRLFQDHPDVLADYHRKFRYVLVDEYQDTNTAQYLWLRLLAQGSKNICCVGDDDQSIYGWRGAEVGNILRFESDFPGAKIIRLERNYRSTPNILGAASGLIATNEDRLGKTLWTEGDAGEKIRVRGLWDGEEEARFVAEKIETLHRQGQSLDTMAILVRASSQMREFEERFVTTAIPYRVIGGPRFYERMEIRDALAYLRVIQSPDDDLAFERIVNKPKRGLGDATLQALHAAARLEGVSLTAAAGALVQTDELKPRARNALAALLDDFARWRQAAEVLPHPELTETVLDESGYTEMFQMDRSPEAPGRLDNLKELVRAMEAFENLGGFLEHVSLVMENEQSAEGEKVSIMTLHGAKGLEFDTVFLPGWEEGLFPSQRTLDESGLKGLEEERRLAYVGITRAKRRAIITHASNRRLYNQWQSALPSRFLEEIPDAHVEKESAPGLYASYSTHDPFRGAGHAPSTYSSPGWARLRENVAQGRYARSPVVDSVAELVATNDPAAANAFAKGMRVFHQKFGYGRIQQADGNKLVVAFDKAGTKKVISSFVERA